MPTLSVKENFMRLMNGEMPEYIPIYNMMWGGASVRALMGTRNPDGTGKSIWGVDIVQDSGGILPPMSRTSEFILKDITKWRDVIKAPDLQLDASAWEAMAKEANDNRNPDLPFGGGPGGGPFQLLVGFMGFTEGLSACFEEPEEVKALLDYLCDFYEDIGKNIVHYYKPDYGSFGDDIAHERNPFVSLEMFQDIFAPYWRRIYKIYLDADLRSTHHNCGHFELFLDDLVDMGANLWEPAQDSNDYAAIKAKYGRKLAICNGGPDPRMMPNDVTEEEVRARTRAFFDVLAPGGGYAIFEFDGAVGVPSFRNEENQRIGWIYDEFLKIQYTYYQ
ncbi:MAG: veratrol--corrinoid protein metyltransferase [Coriobacteriia bacterium]|nr:veratrol--corrinoid protein metyltransferase [Coriobacteriia bacterium]